MVVWKIGGGGGSVGRSLNIIYEWLKTDGFKKMF